MNVAIIITETQKPQKGSWPRLRCCTCYSRKGPWPHLRLTPTHFHPLEKNTHHPRANRTPVSASPVTSHSHCASVSSPSCDMCVAFLTFTFFPGLSWLSSFQLSSLIPRLDFLYATLGFFPVRNPLQLSMGFLCQTPFPCTDGSVAQHLQHSAVACAPGMTRS